MTVGQRLFWSLGRSDLGGEGVTLPNISRPLFSSFTAQSIHWFPRLGQGWVEILVKKGTVLLPNISPRTLSDHVSQHCDVIRGQKSDVFSLVFPVVRGCVGEEAVCRIRQVLSVCAYCARDRIDLGGCQA